MPTIDLGKIIPTINGKDPADGALSLNANEIPYDEIDTIKTKIDKTDAAHAAHSAESVTYQTKVDKAIATLADINNVDQTIAITLPLAPKNIRFMTSLLSGSTDLEMASFGEYAQNTQSVQFAYLNGASKQVWSSKPYIITDLYNSVSAYEIKAVVKSVSATAIVITWSYTGTPPSGAGVTLKMVVTAMTH